SGSEGGAGAIALEIVLVLVPLAVHAGLGLWSVARGRSGDAGAYGSAAMRAWQRVTGGVLLFFILFHVGETWLGKLSGFDGSASYDNLRATLGRPMHIVIYVVGITCLSFHLALGIGSFASAW